MRRAHGPVRLGLSMAEIRESTIQGQILEYLRWRQIPADPTHSTRNHPETPGMPDIMLALPPWGRMVLLEVKAEDGKLSEDQERVMAKYSQGGAITYVVRSVADAQAAVDDAIDETRTLYGDPRKAQPLGVLKS